MPYRSPARILAPLALAAAVLLTIVVAAPELGGSDDAPSASRTPQPASTSTARKPKPKATSPVKRTTTTTTSSKTYVVQPGDVLGAISEKTGVAVADLLEYNEVDAQNLRVGQELKLAP